MHAVTRFTRFAPALCLALAATVGCGDSGGPSDGGFTVGGSVTNRTGQPIPSNARVVIGWVVSAASPDYTYIFGEGVVQGGSFRVTLREPPPAEALNAGQVGVGVALLTTNPGLQSGVHLEDVLADPTELLGATGRFAVIYKATDAVDFVDWAGAFPLGYSVGVGVERPGILDAFAPVAPASMELIVDDLANIEFVNWT